MNINISIADDHPMVVEGIINMLKETPEIIVKEQYYTGKELLSGLQEYQPDILLMDVHFPDASGHELAREILALYPQQRIIVVTNVSNPFQMKDLMNQGCKGYILKSARKEALVNAIKEVHQNGEYIEPTMKEQLMKIMLRPWNQQPKDIALTDREKEVLELICEGLNNYDIADRLFLSRRTIENHRRTLYEKLKAKNTASLIRSALEKGLFT